MCRIVSVVLALALGLLGDQAWCDDPPRKPAGSTVITGEVAYSDPNAKGRNHQFEAQDALQAWIQGVQAAAKGGGSSSVDALEPEVASYLSVLYFYCTVKDGPCPFVLEGILDAEVMRARATHEISCVSMKRFFKSYLTHGLDARGKFMYPLTRGLEMANFNEQDRPRYVECKETVSAILEDKEAIAQRFGEKGTSLEALAKLDNLVSQVKTNKTDIYVATGLLGGAE
jgi:hypothetical protein